MELNIAGTNMELNPAIHRYVERKLGKLNRHLRNVIETRVEISEEKTKSPQQHYLVRVTVSGGTAGAVFHGEERGEDLFRAIDGVVDIMVRQLERRKGKIHDRLKGSSLARGEFGADSGQKPASKVVKNKRFIIEPMSVEEAIKRMENMGHSFFLFVDGDVSKLKLLYLRKDGNYGVIEPDIE